MFCLLWDNKNKWAAAKEASDTKCESSRRRDRGAFIHVTPPFPTLVPRLKCWEWLALQSPESFSGSKCNCLKMQSTVGDSYSYSVFQVSPTRSVQAQSTLSWHSGRGGASKHPNNYSGSHMTSRWFILEGNRSADKNDSSSGRNAYDMISSSTSEHYSDFFFVCLITQGFLFTFLIDGIVVVCNCMLNLLYLPWVSAGYNPRNLNVGKYEIGSIHGFNSDNTLGSSLKQIKQTH